MSSSLFAKLFAGTISVCSHPLDTYALYSDGRGRFLTSAGLDGQEQALSAAIDQQQRRTRPGLLQRGPQFCSGFHGLAIHFRDDIIRMQIRMQMRMQTHKRKVRFRDGNYS